MVSDSKPFPQGEEGFSRWSKIRVSDLLAKNTLSENKGGCQRLWIILWNCVFMHSIFMQSNRCCGWRKGAWDHSDKGMSFLAEYGKTQGFWLYFESRSRRKHLCWNLSPTWEPVKLVPRLRIRSYCFSTCNIFCAGFGDWRLIYIGNLFDLIAKDSNIRWI
jgi:hypothetical protein